MTTWMAKSYINLLDKLDIRMESIYDTIKKIYNYRVNEYNKQLCSDEWKNLDINDGKPFFTLMTMNEIESFCKKWENKIGYQLEGFNSNLFTSVLAYWLN